MAIGADESINIAKVPDTRSLSSIVQNISLTIARIDHILFGEHPDAMSEKPTISAGSRIDITIDYLQELDKKLRKCADALEALGQ